MRKLFDKYIAQSSKGQFAALSVAFILLILIGAVVGRFIAGAQNPDNVTAFGRPETWGFMQCVDGGFVQASIANNTTVADDGIVSPAPMPVILLSLGFWLAGMVLVSFFTGVATEFLNSRREKILSGEVKYRFKRNFILIVGYDFQVKNLVHVLMRERKGCDIVLITDSPVAQIHEEILPEIGAHDARRLYILRRDITVAASYAGVTLAGAEEIYLIGDGEAPGRDGKTLLALDVLAQQAYAAAQMTAVPRVKVYLHLEEAKLYSQVRAMKLPADTLETAPQVPVFDLEVFNYYESWAWECWAHRDSADGRDAYLPLRHLRGSKHAELFIIGAGRMGRAMADFAVPLLNYGEAGKHCRITVFDPDGMKKGLLPDRETVEALPETDLRFLELDAGSDEASALMLEASDRPETAVTVVVALPDPGAALRVYAALSNRLRRKNLSVLIWQATHSSHCPGKEYLKMGGADACADKTTLRYFGMTDRLPWRHPARREYAMAVNYFYESWFPFDKPAPHSPKAADPDFCAQAKATWATATDALTADERWEKTPRWKKWASVNSGDSFKEKAQLFREEPYAAAADRLLKAEHNRWWCEKLLAGWVGDESLRSDGGSHADKLQMRHGDMVPFEALSEDVKDKDKINLAAMTVQEFI